MALPQSIRFADRRELKKVLATGRRVPSPLGLVFIAPALSRGGRIAFVVSSKVAKESSRRNRIRRQLADFARLRFFGRRATRDLVVLVSSLASSWPPRVLRERAEKTLDILERL